MNIDLYRIRRYAIVGTLLLVLTLVVFELIPLDLWVENLFYAHHHWVWLKNEGIGRFLLYVIPRDAVAILAVTAIATMVLFARSGWLSIHARGIRILLLSLVLVPLVVGALKQITNVACPSHVIRFGGDLPYVTLFGHYPEGMKPAKTQLCFPAGHASAGFALLSLAFLFHSRCNRVRALVFAMAVGWLMGLYKMAIGDHYLSHTIISMLLAWVVICIIVMVDYSLPGNDSSWANARSLSENRSRSEGSTG